MENNKMTAVEWLYQKMYQHKGLITIEEYNQALQMEKEQSINDYCNGRNSVIEKSIISAEQYYNETYGNK